VAAALLSTYGAQFGSYTTMLWQVPALSLTAQAFLLSIAFGRDASHAARLVTGLLSALTSSMSIYLMLSHRIHAARQGRVAAALAQQLGAEGGGGRRGPADVWLGVNRGSFALWLSGLAVFGIVGLWVAGLNTLKIIGW
jgi:hypothetical protein